MNLRKEVILLSGNQQTFPKKHVKNKKKMSIMIKFNYLPHKRSIDWGCCLYQGKSPGLNNL